MGLFPMNLSKICFSQTNEKLQPQKASFLNGTF